jgi:hypothetical protein
MLHLIWNRGIEWICICLSIFGMGKTYCIALEHGSGGKGSVRVLLGVFVHMEDVLGK